MKYEDLFEFYVRKRPDVVDPKSKRWEILKDTPLKAYGQLSKLCDGNEKCMLSVIDHLVNIPADQKLDRWDRISKEERRAKNQNTLKKNKREEQKLTKEFIEAIDTIRYYDKTFDPRKALESAKWDWNKRFGRDFGAFLRELSKHASMPSRGNNYFNETICEIYKVAKGASKETDNYIFENMAKLLSSLKLKTKTGGEYRRNNIHNIVKRGNLRPSSKFHSQLVARL